MLIVITRLAIVSILTCLVLSSCIGNSGSPADPPTNVQAFPGDGNITVTWDDNPSVQYWVFYAQDPTLSTTNWTNLLSANAIVNTSSPMTLCNLINNPYPTSLFPQYFFTINGRTGTSPGGAGSPLVSTSPRPAGGPQAPWVLGTPIPVSVAGLGYGILTPCGWSGRPPSGIYVAVGPAGAVYSSYLAPTVAGALAASNGNNAMTWTAGNLPPGFNQDLSAVAAYSGPINPAAPNLIFVAVGKNGTILRSTDGQNWAQISGVPTTNNLNAVAFAGSAFIAVGDGGVVLTSSNGLTWTQSLGPAVISSNNLNAIHCTGGYCLAVGAGGTTLWTTSSGASWVLYPQGLNDWITVAYGNNDANANPPVVTQIGEVLTINRPAQYISTWVIADANGNYAYTTSPGTWISGNAPIATSVVAMDYTTRFVALDAAGNTYASQNATSWALVGSSGLTAPTAIFSNGQGFVALDSSGANASSF